MVFWEHMTQHILFPTGIYTFLSYATLGGIILFAILSRKDFLNSFSKLKTQTWIILFIIVLLGLFVRINVSPFTDNLDSVGWPYIDMALRLAKGDLFVESTFGDRTIGYPLIISFFYRLFGSSTWIVHVINISFGTLNIIGVFLLSHMLFKKENLALVGSLLMAVDPNIIRYAAVNASNSVYFFFIILALISMLLFKSIKKQHLLFLTISLLAFSHFIRFEFMAVSLPFALWVLFLAKGHLKPGIIFFSLAVFMMLMIPSIASLTYHLEPLNKAALDDSAMLGNKNPQILTPGRLSYNLSIFMREYLEIVVKLGVLLLPLMLGLYLLLTRDHAKYKVQFGILIIWWILQNFSYLVSRIDSRYIRFAYLPFLIMISFLIFSGLQNLRLLRHHVPLKLRPPTKLFAIFLIFVFFSGPVYSAMTMEKIRMRDGELVSELMQQLKLLDKDSYIILAGCGVKTMMKIVGNDHYIPFKNFDIIHLKELLAQSKSVHLIIYKEYFDEELNYQSYCYGKEFESGKQLKNNFTLKLIESKKTLDIYRLEIDKN